MSVFYEWDVEEVAVSLGKYERQDVEEGDIVEHWFQDNFADCLKHVATQKLEPGFKWEIVLVRNTDATNAEEPRTWAYLNDNGTLPEFFQGSGGDDQTRVPQRFHKEVEQSIANTSRISVGIC
jgi:hypothetical protein